MSTDEKDTTPPSEDGANDKVDWDSSWNEYSSSRRGGVFKLEPNAERQKEDKRIERLTSLWTSETGFLVAIGVIVAIGFFYTYVMVTGGIENQYQG